VIAGALAVSSADEGGVYVWRAASGQVLMHRAVAMSHGAMHFVNSQVLLAKIFHDRVYVLTAAGMLHVFGLRIKSDHISSSNSSAAGVRELSSSDSKMEQ
jgi:hypothetical protein